MESKENQSSLTHATPRKVRKRDDPVQESSTVKSPDHSDNVHIDQYPKGKLLIGLGGSTKLSATVTMASQTAFIKWQKVEVDGPRNLLTDSMKYSGSSCSLPSPELIINDVDETDNGLYQLCVTAFSTTVTGPKVMIEVFGDLDNSLPEEEIKFLRCYLLCQKIATKSVRLYMTRKVPEHTLAAHLKSHTTYLKLSKWKCNSDQLAVLFPAVQGNVKAKNFDFTLLYKLIRNTITHMSAPTRGWGSKPLPGDITEEDDIERIRENRNLLAHNTEFKLNDSDFTNMWTDLSQAIYRLSLGSLSNEVRSVEKKKLDRHLKNEIFENLKRDIETIKDEMNALHQEMFENKDVIIQHDKRIKKIEDHHIPASITHNEFGIIQNIEIDEILDYMITQLVLSIDDRCQIEHHPRHDDRNKALLDIMHARGEPSYVAFINGLEKSVYADEARELKDYYQSMDTRKTFASATNQGLSKRIVPLFKIRLQKNYSMIVNDLRCDAVLDYLVEDEVFSLDDIQVISACSTYSQKNRKLMDKLLRRSEKGFNAFLSALRKEHFDYIADHIEATSVTRIDVSTFQSCIK